MNEVNNLEEVNTEVTPVEEVTVVEENIPVESDSILVANSGNVKLGQKYRITVLTERLIRLEYSNSGIFNDEETELVKFRKFPKVDFEVQEDSRYLVIKTKYFSLSYSKERSFEGSKLMPMANLKVDLLGTDHSWYYNHPEIKNFKGNFVALDGSESDSKARNGLYSLDGFATLTDNTGENKQVDIYLFMYNKDFDLALKDYFMLTGYPSMIPRYSLGNWWSRDLNYTQEEIEELVNNFEKNELPLSVLLLDNGWHVDKNEEDKPLKTGYTFDKDKFSDPTTLIKNLHEKNIHIGLQFNPIDGINPHEEHYLDIANKYGIVDNKIIAFDANNPELLNSIYELLLKPLKDKGIDFFWNDIDSKEIDVNGLYNINKSLYTNPYTNDTRHRLILARNGLIATHRYPVTYTGKTIVGWDMLKKVIRIQENASNMGLTWVSNDVNGNYGGIEEEELYVRAVEQATLGPIVRFHAPRGRYYRKEPWRWNAKTVEIVSRFLKLRHRMIPYLYTKAYDYHKNGNLMIKPLYYNYPWVYDDDDYKNEYFLGDLLVSPILTKKDTLINRTIHRVFIPDGVWYDFITGKKFPGNKQYISFYRDEDYPIFVRRGGIIPLNNNTDLNSTTNPESLELHIFPGESNTFNLYEDKDDNEDNHLITQIDYNYLPSNYTVIIRTLEGKRGVVEDYRNYKIRFRNTKKAENVICYFNDTQIKTMSYVDGSDFIVEINKVPSLGQLTLNCKGKDIEIDAVRLINDDIDSILLDLPINTVLKEQISSIMFSNLPLKRKRIEIRKLKKYNLDKEYIKLFLKLLEYIGTI